MKNAINENTKVTVSLVITLAGLAFWLGTVASKADSTSIEVTNIRQDQQEFQRDVINRLGRIEGRIERLKNDN